MNYGDRWMKSPEVLAVGAPQSRLCLLHQATHSRVVLDAQQARTWLEWPAGKIGGSEVLGDALTVLREGAFIVPAPGRQMVLEPSDADGCIPTVAKGSGVKWYAESEDCFVLFNTSPMRKNNPLLVLGPYGSLCWRGVLDGRTLRETRSEALRVFGTDEVPQFMRRLCDLGFLDPIGTLDGTDGASQTIVKEFTAPTVQHQLTHARVPWYCLWEVCRSCDLRCQTCYLPEFETPGPSVTEAPEIAQSIVDAGVFYLCIMGGEPLLRQDLEEIVLRFRDAGVFVKVISNGHSLTSCRAESLCKAGLNQIEVSLDGLLPETHNASRGPGSFEKALRGVKRAIDGGIPRVGLVWTVHSTNVHECDRLPWLMQDLRVEECYLSRFRKTGLCGSAAPFNPPSDSDLTLLRSSIGQWRRAFPNLTIVLPEACSCGRTSVVLGADGAVRVCSFLYESHGNVKKEPLRAIWDRLGELAQASGPLGYCGKPELAFMKHSE